MTAAHQISYIINGFILFGGGFAWVLAIGQLVLRSKRPSNYMLAVFMFLLGVWQILGGLVFLGLFSHTSFNVYTISVPVFFLSVPFLFFYVRYLTKPNYQLGVKSLLHLIVPVASFFLLAPYAFSKIQLYQAMSFSHISTASLPEMLAGAVMYTSMVLYLGYMVVLIKDILGLINQMEIERNKTLGLALVMVAFFIALNVFWFVDRALSLGLQQVPYICATLVVISLYLISLRLPEYLLMIKAETERVRTGQSQIGQLDVDGILRRLEELMSWEKLYQNRDITLRSLAERLNVSPHQLSEIINQRLNKNFYALINQYRIDQAKALLSGDPEQKIISIAFEVGFNSPSAFYNAFKKIAGCTPTAFRQNSISS